MEFHAQSSEEGMIAEGSHTLSCPVERDSTLEHAYQGDIDEQGITVLEPHQTRKEEHEKLKKKNAKRSKWMVH
ncbi:240_t:CDS:2 [Diversispora eburnea]|uniref:240_t:CDS:1 n=1 Tax=Diversispora eburnea TaxID=1213867 RepID=A0A9N9AE07_9GLOM|nr:240_t:CDS:2 [Diversispora eburnea]